VPKADWCHKPAGMDITLEAENMGCSRSRSVMASNLRSNTSCFRRTLLVEARMALENGWKRRLISFVVSLFVLAAPMTAQGQQSTAKKRDVVSKTPMKIAEIARRVSKATVLIRTLRQDNSQVSGSGFIVDPSGTIVTNAHVVDSGIQVGVRLHDGETYDVIGVRAIDWKRDIAVIQIPGFKLPTVTLGDSDSVRPGEEIVVIGNALGILEDTITTGVISGVRTIHGRKLFQMDAAVSPGNSGGPVVDRRGEVIGITVLKLTKGESLNFAIPVNYARGMLSFQLEKGLTRLVPSENSLGNLFADGSRRIPSRWKSLTSGAVKKVRAGGDHLYVETVVPEEYQAAGVMSIAELKKDGEKWVGENRVRSICVVGGGPWVWSKSAHTKQCSFEWDIEIDLLSPTRIEGFVVAPPADAKLKCKKCKYNKKPVKQAFTWIPE